MRRWRKSTKLLGLTSFELGEYMIFFHSTEKINSLRKATSNLGNKLFWHRVFFFQIRNDTIKIFLFYLLNTPRCTLEFHLEFHISGGEIYVVQRLSSKPKHYLKHPTQILKSPRILLCRNCRFPNIHLVLVYMCIFVLKTCLKDCKKKYTKPPQISLSSTTPITENKN